MEKQYKITLTEWEMEEIKEAARYLKAYEDKIRAGAGDAEKKAARIAATEAAIDVMAIFKKLPDTPF